MRRKTAPQDPVHPEVSRAAASEVGLIAKAEESAQSAMGEYVLDNRSHRTTQGSSARPTRKAVVGEIITRPCRSCLLPGDRSWCEDVGRARWLAAPSHANRGSANTGEKREGLFGSSHWKVGNRSCAGNEVAPANACASAASSSDSRLAVRERVFNSAAHEKLSCVRTRMLVVPGSVPVCHQFASPWTGRTHHPDA